MLKSHEIIRIALAVLFVLAAIFVTSETATQLYTKFGGQTIREHNLAFLEIAVDQPTKDFLLFSEILGAVEVLSSTDFGIKLILSASVEVGQVLAALSKVIEDALDATMLAALTTEVLIGIAKISGLVDILFLQATLFSGALFLIISILLLDPNIRKVSRDLVELFSLLFLMSYIVVPYTVNLTGWAVIQNEIGLPVGHQQAVENLHSDIARAPTGAAGIRYWIDRDRVQGALDRGNKNIGKKIAVLQRYVIDQIAYSILAGLLFPMMVALILWLVFRRIITTIGPWLDTKLKVLDKDT